MMTFCRVAPEARLNIGSWLSSWLPSPMQQYRRIPPSRPLAGTSIVPLTATCPVGVGKPPVGGGLVGGGLLGGRLDGGRLDGGRVVPPGVVGVTPPVHVTPLTAKLVGAGLLLLFQVPLKPNEVEAFVPRVPL